MSDIVTRLLLKTNDFDANLNKAKGSVGGFQSSISNMASVAGAGLMKFAGAIGAVVGSAEAFNKTINSTQTTGDEFTKIIDQGKASVDAFFTSIAMGNFGGFISNLTNVIDKAGTLSMLLDELATKDLFTNAELNNLLTQKRLQENIAKDRTKSDEERNKALEKARKIQQDINALQKSLAGTQKQSAYAMLDSAIAKQGLKSNVSRDTWDFVLKETNRDKVIQYSDNFKQNRKDGTRAVESNKGGIGGFVETEEFKNYKNTPLGKLEEFMYIFSELDDSIESDLGQAIELIKKSNSMYSAISDAELQLSMTDARINGSFQSNNKDDKQPIEDTIEWYDAQIRAKTKELSEATTMQARIAAQTAINELQDQKIRLQFVVDKGAFQGKHGEMKGGELNPTLGDSTKSSLGKELKGVKLQTPITKKDVALNENYAESLGMIGSAMGNVAGMFDGSSASILQWGASLLMTIAQSLPAIDALMAKKVANIGVTTAETTAEVTDAAAKNMNAHAGIPFIGVAMGVAGIAAIIAAMASIPKFANGGIVSGRTLAEVGEYPGASSNPEVIAPLSKLKQLIKPEEAQAGSVGGNVTFRIKGKDLEGLLNNVRNQKNKVR